MSSSTQPGTYMPQSDVGFRNWLMNFSRLVGENPHRYGLTLADAQIITNHYQSYDAAFTAVQAPGTRTSPAIAHKDAVKASAMASLRIYAGLIRANMGVDIQDRRDLGLGIENTSRARIPAPRTAPILSIICSYLGSHQLRFCDENTPASRRKPPGVAQLWVAMAVTDANQPRPNDPESAKIIGAFTKQPLFIEHDPKDNCRMATYFGRWSTATGLVGPWSLPVSMGITSKGGGDAAQDGATSSSSTPVVQRRAA